MPLSAGTRLGPYEVVSFLSAGGMGEVYRARDTRLNRCVAIKVLPPSFANDPDRLRRFEHEARAVAALNHPNILALYDIGSQDGNLYLVSELLEGTTLREQLAKGALPARKAMEYGLQIAHGLAAAHDKGIVHRDLKPENIFVTKDARVKILDFGLAKATVPAATLDGTTLSQTKPGVVLGTVGYMSPEQVRGDHIDYRSDIFSFGAVLYEMFSGKRAFPGDSGVEIMSAILRTEPPKLTHATPPVHPATDHTIRHCLEKDPSERFQSAHDLAFQLKITGEGVFSQNGAEVAEKSLRRKHLLPALAGLALVVALLPWLIPRLSIKRDPPAFKRLTFRMGSIGTARFSIDGRNVIYGAAWEGQPSEIFVGRTDGSEARPLGIGPSELLSVSKNGELAVLLKPSFDYALGFGTLATVPLEGGTPREIAENITSAEWTPDGSGLAMVRDANRLEFPIGKVLFQSVGWLSHPRFSPDGTRIAFIDHLPATDSGSLVICDMKGAAKTLATGFNTGMVAGGVAWSRNGKEVWFSGSRGPGAVTIMAVSLAGRERLVARTTVGMTIHDIAADGRVLLSGDEYRVGIKALAPHSGEERDLSWLDWSLMGAISPDGEMIAFAESGETASGTLGHVYIRDTGGATPAVRLGDGRPWAITPDRKWVIATTGEESYSTQLVMLPTGVGEPRRFPVRNTMVSRSRAFPDSKRILFNERTPDNKRQAYVMSLETGEAKPVLPPGVVGTAISPDGRYIAGLAVSDRTSKIYDLLGGSPRPIMGLKQGERVMAWGNPPLPLYVSLEEGLFLDLFRLDPTTGQRQLWRHLTPSDPAGVRLVADISNGIAPTAQAYGYSYYRLLSQLSIAKGLR